ncbi:MAG TPA: hypothetical protein VD710_11385 [Nitrososphaeraceae archaeon]|nr:hypothetical protein [Nitrososphaeraceae archaeon]
MDKNHKMISNLTKLKDEHKFHEDRNWNKFENSEEFDDILYFEYARFPRLVTRVFDDE